LIAESLAKRPWVIGKYLAVWPLMKALAMGMNDLDDDDWDDLRFIHKGCWGQVNPSFPIQ